MKNKTIKFKITCLYTGIISVLLAIVTVFVFVSSENYGLDKVKAELVDEVKDLKEDIRRYPLYFPRENLLSYYDDGVMMSIYDGDKNFINGVIPDEFPSDTPFAEEEIRSVETSEDNWFILDGRITMENGEEYWIRGIHSYGPVVLMFQRLLFLSFTLFPAFILLTAFIGYRMIRRSLAPIQSMTKRAGEIATSGQLSLRLPEPKAQDEIYELCRTFNRMFARLEEQFTQEKQLSSDAAHELRTPLSLILSRCEYCLQELPMSPELSQELTAIRQKTLTLSSLVSRLLEIARAENGTYTPDFEEISLTFLAESVIEELEEKAKEKNICMECVCEQKDPMIQGDVEMLTRMFINLTDNAIAYGRENGTLTIRIQEYQQNMCIEFIDNGIGIPPESLPKIWNRFYQADKSRSLPDNFGLGLFLVKYIIEMHRGTITVESRLNEGTTFTIILPKTQS
ncbi:MAG TPA: HAMP domain-containing protein [Candidatus Blautia faecigallinarum]|uniref:histidine kinase n=1 Tax=Candidatus Blautia faecigallinarum TaxID=2838488 RepID=A0A9D2DTA1_9FIRM|nr:HAMP domain-containing protein [Candidatus Blautia faecigallinarum]